nr:hypothetical protein [Tanacetum cinerariifolium]
MANLDFCKKHNMVTFLEKSEGSEGFHQILDFLNSTHIKIKTITEASIRRHLKMEDSDGITTLPNAEIFEQLALMGGGKLLRMMKTSQFHWYKMKELHEFKRIIRFREGLGRTSADTEILLDQEEPTELVEDLGSGEKGEKEISTVIPELQEVIAEADTSHDIDWNDPAVLRYHALQNRSFLVAEVRKNMCMYLKNRGGYKKNHFKGMSYEDIRLIFERVWDQIHAFVHMDSEIKKEVMKKSGFDLQQNQFAEKVNEKKDDSSSKLVGGSRKKIGGYKKNHFKGMSYEDIRLIFERVWDQIHAFVPMDSEIKKEVMKKSGFDLQQNQFVEKVSEKKDDSSTKLVGGSRKKIGRTSADTEILLDQEEPTELVEDLGSGEKGEKEISTVIPEKKSKKQLEQERLGHEEAIRLQEQNFKEERQRITKDAEIAK